MAATVELCELCRARITLIDQIAELLLKNIQVLHQCLNILVGNCVGDRFVDLQGLVQEIHQELHEVVDVLLRFVGQPFLEVMLQDLLQLMNSFVVAGNDVESLYQYLDEVFLDQALPLVFDRDEFSQDLQDQTRQVTVSLELENLEQEIRDMAFFELEHLVLVIGKAVDDAAGLILDVRTLTVLVREQD